MQRKKSGKKLNIFALALALVVVVGSLGVFINKNRVPASASVSRDECITFAEYAEDYDINSATLIVGVYVMELVAVTDDVYEKAKESGEDIEQTDVYYKSEIGDDSWYLITDAESVDEITEDGGETVDESDMASLLLKYYVDEDGTVTDLYTGEEGVNTYDDPDPYDKWLMDEYDELVALIDDAYLTDSSDDAAIAYNYANVVEHLNYRNTDDYTDERDAEEDSVFLLQTALAAEGDDDSTAYAEGLEKVLYSIDCDRRAHYMNNILTDLDIMGGTTELSDATDNPSDYSSEVEEADESTSTAVDDTIENLEGSIITLETEIISDPGDTGTELASKKYELYETICEYDSETNGITDSINNTILQFICCYNIEDGLVEYQSDELDLIDELLPLAITKYEAALDAGASEYYYTAEDQGTEESGLAEILSDQQSDNNDIQQELRVLIEAEELRVEDEDFQTFIKERIIEAVAMFDGIQTDDAYYDYAVEELVDYITYLTDFLDTSDSSDDDTSELYEGLLEEAENNNDLSTATEVQMLIDATESDESEESTSDNSDLMEELLEEAASDLASGNTTSGSLTALTVLGEDTSELVEEYGDTATEALANANALTDTDNLDEDDDLLAQFAAALDKTVPELDTTDICAIIASACELKDERLRTLDDDTILALLNRIKNSGLVYKTYTDDEDELFVSLKAVASATGEYRYIFNDRYKVANLQKSSGGGAYSFEADSTLVENSDDSAELEKAAVKANSALYLSNQDSVSIFDVMGASVTGTKYSVAMNTETQEKYNTILETLKN